MTLIILALSVVVTAAGIAIFAPYGPFKTRSSAVLTSFLALGGILISGALSSGPLLVLQSKNAQPQSNATAEQQSSEAERSSGSHFKVTASGLPLPPTKPMPGTAQGGVVLTENKPEYSGCGTGGLAIGDQVAVRGEYNLRTKPSASAPKLVNQKASNALGRAHYHSVDGSTVLKRVCVQENWTLVQYAKPEWLTHVSGWMPNDRVRLFERNKFGHQILIEDDFLWDKDTRRYKSEIVAIVNKIAVENNKCREPDPSSVARSTTRGTRSDPVFFVTCSHDGLPFNIWFSPKDAVNAKSFVAVKPLNRSAAVAACREAAMNAATHPSTVKFSEILDLSYATFPSGRAVVSSSFKARNALGLELKYAIHCYFDGATFTEHRISEFR